MIPVRFFLAGEPELDRLRELDADRDWRELQTGERAWALQTFLRLRAAGDPVELVGRVPDDGIVVFHAKQEREVRRSISRGGSCVLVGARADNRQALAAEIEVLQSRRWENGRDRIFVPHWPQPGLRRRDPARGTRIEQVAYKGFDANLHPAFRGDEWRQGLERLGVRWLCDEIEFDASGIDHGASRWTDYRSVDAVCAVRPPTRRRRHSKPATKLVNAWLSGSIPILGDEPAYREIRRSELDYLAVHCVPSALAGVERLIRDPALARAMVENGFRRAAEYDVAAVTARWRELLFERVPALTAERRFPARRLPLELRRTVRWLERVATGRPPR